MLIRKRSFWIGLFLLLAVQVGLGAGHASSEVSFGVSSTYRPYAYPAASEGTVTARYEFRLVIDPPRPEAGKNNRVQLTVLPRDQVPFRLSDESQVQFNILSRNLEEFHSIRSFETASVIEGSREGVKFTFPADFGSGGFYCLCTSFIDRGVVVSYYYRIGVEGPDQRWTRWNFSRGRKTDGIRAVLYHNPPLLKEKIPVDVSIRLSSIDKQSTALETYGGALAYLTIFREGMMSPAHLRVGSRRYSGQTGQQEKTSRGGPYIKFGHVFPTNGKYRIFSQFQHNGKPYMILFDLWIEEEQELEIRGGFFGRRF